MFTGEEFPNADYYRSDLRKLLKDVRELKAKVAEWDTYLVELEKIPVLEQKISALTNEITDIENELIEMSTWKTLVTNELLQIENKLLQITNKLKNIDNMFISIQNDYNNKFYSTNLRITQLYNNVIELIDGIIRRMEYIIEHLSSDVRDPILDIRVTFDKNNNDIYNRLDYGCLTESEFAELGITENTFKSLKFTQYQYATISSKVLGKYFIFSPKSGLRFSHYQAIADVLTYLCGTMTETEFANLNLTEDEFEALNLTHEDYLRYNSSVGGVNVNPLGNGLTEEQYQHLTVG